jgi:hypothetical protein
VSQVAAQPHDRADCSSAELTLRQNLDQLVPVQLAPRVETTAVSRVELRPGRRGLDLRLAGIALRSTIDPLVEAEAWADQIDLQDVDLLVVFGLALGDHLRALRRRSAVPIVVLEPSLEVLRVALSAVRLDLPDVMIVDTPAMLRELLTQRLAVRDIVSARAWPAYGRLFPQLFLAAQQAAQQAATLATVTANTLGKRVEIWTDNLLQNLPQCVGRLPATELRGWLRGRGAIIVAAGPSLDRNVAELRRAQDRAAVIAVNTSLRALERAGVRADLVVSLEVLDVTSQLDGLPLNGACPRLLDVTANPRLFQGAVGPVIPFANNIPFFAPLVAEAGLGEGFFMGGSVANAAFSLAREMGADPIVLVGQDLAYGDGRLYATGTVFDQLRVEIKGGVAQLDGLEAKQRIAASLPEADTTMPLREVEPVPGWGGGTVWTNIEFNYFRYNFERWAQQLTDRTLINATEGGARIRGFAERRLAEVLDALPPCPPPPLPRGPLLAAGPVHAVLARERDAARAVRRAAEAAVERCTVETLQLMREALERSHVLQALCWPASNAARHTVIDDVAALCRQVADDADRSGAALERALHLIPQR